MTESESHKKVRPHKTHPSATTPSGAEPSLTIFGREGRGGVYVLRFRVKRPFTTPCGRFKNGKPITFAIGDYLYVGRAMAQKGSLCLARRLVRHASRLADGRPHPIRSLMLSAFAEARLCDGDVTPSKPKKPRWNVDHPLNHPSAELMAAYLIRTGLNVEADLGKFLERDGGTAVFERGLGANDIGGNTHLLRVTGGESWWDALPAKLNNFAKLSNMWPSRANAVLARVAAGDSFTRAMKASEGGYDTVNWDEVPSRLRRGRGAVVKAAALLTGPNSPAESEDQRRTITDAAAALKASVERLRTSLANVGGDVAGPSNGTQVAPSVKERSGTTTFKQVVGMMKLCAKFVEKNARDVPRIRRRTGAAPDRDQVALALAELGWIDKAVARLQVHLQ